MVCHCGSGKRVEAVSEFTWKKIFFCVEKLSSKTWKYMKETTRIRPYVYLELQLTAFELILPTIF